MTAIQVLGLIAFIIALSGVLGFLFQAGNDEEEEVTFTTPEYTKEELENIKAAEAEYNKPVVAEELEVTEPEFVAKGLSSTPVAPEFPNIGKDLTKVFPPDATINTEEIVETKLKKVKEPKSEFPIDKPKKKRKYYPKKAK